MRFQHLLIATLQTNIFMGVTRAGPPFSNTVRKSTIATHAPRIIRPTTVESRRNSWAITNMKIQRIIHRTSSLGRCLKTVRTNQTPQRKAVTATVRRYPSGPGLGRPLSTLVVPQRLFFSMGITRIDRKFRLAHRPAAPGNAGVDSFNRKHSPPVVSPRVHGQRHPHTLPCTLQYPRLEQEHPTVKYSETESAARLS